MTADMSETNAEAKRTKFIKREIDKDPMYLFQDRISSMIPSLIAFSYGTKEDGSPNILGTGFCVGSEKGGKGGLFATCFHLMDEISRLKNLGEDELKKEGLIDKNRRIATFVTDHFEWVVVEPIKYSNEIMIGEKNFAKTHDVCICYISGLNLPALNLSPNEYFIGCEVGIAGFPTFDKLQGITVQPYVMKTILSSHMLYPFERDTGEIESERLALGCIVGPGFSGSPVFSIQDGTIIGMIDYTPPEIDFCDIKITKPALLEGDARLSYPAGISLAVPSTRIQQCLEMARSMDWYNPQQQEFQVSKIMSFQNSKIDDHLKQNNKSCINPITELQPNQPIPIKEGNWRIVQNESDLSGKGSILFHWFPEPGYYFTFYSEKSLFRGYATLITSEGDNIPVIVRWIWGSKNKYFKIEGSLRTHIKQGDIEEKINNLACFVTNFYIIPLNYMVLKYNKWEILLYPFENIKNLFKQLDRNGGYAFTYNISIRYAKGSPFTMNEAKFLMEPLSIFLSFIRGVWCKVLFFHGSLDGNSVVAVHPNPLLPPFTPLASWPKQPESLIWCHHHLNQDINKIFNYIVKIFENSQLKNSTGQIYPYIQLKSAIINCIELNSSNFGETAIVLVQSALESLAYMHASKCLQGICYNSFVECNADVKIRWLLNELRIPTSIPPEAIELQDYLEGKKINPPIDGPKAIACLRDGVTNANPKILNHPMRPALDLISFEIPMDYAISLGKMYVELVILTILGYQGNYTNKFTGLIQKIPLKAIALSQKSE